MKLDFFLIETLARLILADMPDADDAEMNPPYRASGGRCMYALKGTSSVRKMDLFLDNDIRFEND